MNVSDECNLFAVSSAVINIDFWRVLHCTEREREGMSAERGRTN